MADYYGTAAGYIAYWTARNAAAPTDDNDDILAALLVGSEYLDANYRNSYSGQKVNGRSQVRDWPRAGAYDNDLNVIADDEIPREVENATYEAAKRELASPGSLRTDVTMGKAISSVSIDGALSVTYSGAASAADYQVDIPIIGAILAPILNGGSGVSALSSMSGRMV